jgi:hypothetical protein
MSDDHITISTSKNNLKRKAMRDNHAPVILAVLQNQWFRDPDRVRASLERFPEGRRRMIHYALFAGCRTGKVLKSVFVDLCAEIIWEEASPEIGGKASSCFPADHIHLQSVLDEVKPDVVLGFGCIATDALAVLVPPGKLLTAPHPAARGVDVIDQIKMMRERLNGFIIP